MAQRLKHQSAQRATDQIEQYYRRQIVTGGLAPGTKLPSNMELARFWSTSTAAVQQALATLAAEGMLERRQRRGTFVRDLRQRAFVGLLFGPNLIRSSAGFYRVLCAALERELDKIHLAVRVYDNLTFMEMNEAERLHHDLRLDRHNYPFNGYVMIGTSKMPADLLADDLKPRVVVQDAVRGNDLLLDYADFVRVSLREMAQRGFRRVIYLRTVASPPPGFKTEPVPGLAQEAQALGLEVAPPWEFHLNGSEPDLEFLIDAMLAEGLASGRFQPWWEEGPVALLLEDDLLLRPVVSTLLRRGVRFPGKVAIATLANRGNRIYCGVPIFHYEFSLTDLARTMIGILHTRMRNLEPLEALPILFRGTFHERFSGPGGDAPEQEE